MSDPDANKPERIEWQGKFITTKTRGRWEYVARARGIRAAAIIAIDDEGHVILVEQYRVPLGKICLEIPAGLIGDDEGKAGEAAEEAQEAGAVLDVPAGRAGGRCRRACGVGAGWDGGSAVQNHRRGIVGAGEGADRGRRDER